MTVNKEAYEWFTDLSRDHDFKECTELSTRQYDRQYDVELVIRFVTLGKLSRSRLRSIGDISEFLTDKSVEIADPTVFKKSWTKEEKAFRFTFSRLVEELGKHSFRRFDAENETHSGRFLISGFEAIAIGLGYNYEKFAKGGRVPDLTDSARSIWQNAQFKRDSGSGVTASTRIASIIPLGRRLFGP